MKKKLFIIGGHLSPALAVADELRERFSDWELVFIGRTYAFETDTEVSHEYTAVTGRNIRFLSLTTGRLQRTLSIMTLVSLIKIPVGFIQAFIFCIKEKPDLIVSFGGYLALPVVWSGFVLGIPSITHEQTMRPGLTNRLISLFVQKICVTFAQTAKYFPNAKTVVTGLPIRSRLWFVKTSTYSESEYKKYPLLYITGGTTGAVSLNNILFPIIPELTKQYIVIHQTGRQSLETARKIQRTLPRFHKRRYIVESYIPEADVAWLLKHAALVINRSGANTIVEIATFGATSLSIPLPWAAGKEQLANAQWLAKEGAAVVLDQTRIAPYDVLRAIASMMTRRKYYKHRAQRLSIRMPRDGTKRMVSQICKLV